MVGQLAHTKSDIGVFACITNIDTGKGEIGNAHFSKSTSVSYYCTYMHSPVGLVYSCVSA